MSHPYTPKVVEKLVHVPDIAWPTIILISCALVTEFSMVYLFHQKLVHPLLLYVVNSIAIFAAFTPMHDAAHGSIGRGKYRWINNVVGHLSALAFPIPFPAFKHLHLQHHKHTNEDEDPDVWTAQGSWFILPFRWISIELHYYYLYISKISERPSTEAFFTLTILFAFIFGLNQLWLKGFNEEILYGILLPGRTAIFFLAIFFDYLPHRPHEHTNQTNVYKATSVTSLIGEHTSLLTWPLLHQNYHNIHHLIPYIPFYLYSDVWHKIKDELRDKGTDVIPILGTRATISTKFD